MSNVKLTRRQQDVLDYLKERQEQGLCAPTLGEICLGLGLSSRGSMHKHVQALVEVGLVDPMDGKQRGVHLASADQVIPAEEVEQLPMLGYIAAGHPIEAIENPEAIEVPTQLRTARTCYVLQVKGDSMQDEGILDGDWVVIEQRDQAHNGDIVVALVDGSEATLKRIEVDGAMVHLHPANSAYNTMSYPAQRVQVQGILVGQMRAYS